MLLKDLISDFIFDIIVNFKAFLLQYNQPFIQQ